MTISNETNTEREIIITRTLNALPELVFEAWTNPEHVAQWWGPNGFTNTIHEMDVRPGGVWRFIMHGPDGVDYPNKIVFKEVIRPALLSYTHSSGDDDDGSQFEVVVTFCRSVIKPNSPCDRSSQPKKHAILWLRNSVLLKVGNKLLIALKPIYQPCSIDH